MQKQLTQLGLEEEEEKEEEEEGEGEKEKLSFTSVKTHFSPHPLTLSASKEVSHDHVAMATDRCLDSVTDEPDTAAAALVAAMATRPHPLKQQPQEVCAVNIVIVFMGNSSLSCPSSSSSSFVALAEG